MCLNGYPLILLLIIIICCTDKPAPSALFNRENLEGWHMDVPDKDTNDLLRDPFIIRNGMLVSLGTPEGHLITDESFENYSLDVEYRFSDVPGNCGILVYASAL
jgi:hypothetical protein